MAVTMPSASEILSDRFMIRYGYRDFFNSYYTCFPVDKEEKLHECLPGKFDACFSEKFVWVEKNWKTLKVPKLLPQEYHKNFMQLKSDLLILKVHHEK